MLHETELYGNSGYEAHSGSMDRCWTLILPPKFECCGDILSDHALLAFFDAKTGANL